MTANFLALTSAGIEILLAEELTTLGAQSVVQKPEGVYFSADVKTSFDICVWSRFASRILLKIGEGEANNKEALYQSAKEIDWSSHFNSEHSFAIDFVGKSKEIRNSQFGGLTVKDAIVDQFRDQQLPRPNVDKFDPNIRFQARLLKGKVAFYLDYSGRALFQRGYREHSGAAPLKENLAAALVKRSGWLEDTAKPLLDPMCGSGTVLIEAVMMAAGYAPGVDRAKWGFEHWLQFDQTVWQQQLAQAQAQSKQGLSELTLKVYGCDIDHRVIKTAKANAKDANVAQFIEFTEQDASKLTNHFGKNGIMLFNPPYGERIGELPELVQCFVELGQQLKQQFIGWQVSIFTANIELLSLLKLTSYKRYKFKNGPLDCQLAQYALDEKQQQKDQSMPEQDFSGQDSAFANRLLKNKKLLKNWLKKEQVSCYRLYDADIPEYNVAVDVYDDCLVIQEYAAPSTISPEKVAKRLQEVIYFAPKVLNISPDKVSLKTRSVQKGSAQYQKFANKHQSMVISEYGAKLKVNLWDYLDTGLFLDHRKTRQIVAQKAKGKSMLNLFAYTGSVSVQAALHGASNVTTVDMSNTYLNWAQENFSLNNLNGHKYQFIQANCLQWLKENTEKYQLIFVDPPTFSNSKRMEDSFDVQRDHILLLIDAKKSLTDDGEIIFTNNKRNFKMDVDALAEAGLVAKNITELTRDKDFQRNKHIHNSWLITQVK